MDYKIQILQTEVLYLGVIYFSFYITFFSSLSELFSNNDFISPSYINLSNPKYLEIDGLKYCGLLITNYNRQQQELILKKLDIKFKEI